jgi:lysozyme family protein
VLERALNAAPWPIDRDDLTSQIRFIVWELEGGNRVGTTLTTSAHDRGRETIAGLTWRCYSEDYLHLPAGQRCPIADFQRLTVDDVVTVMAEVFALRTNLWRIRDARLRLAVVDSAIQFGPGDPIRWLQAALKVPVDGSFGPESLARTNDHADPIDLRDAVIASRIERHALRVIQDQTQLGFLAGWLRRCGRVLCWRAN